MPEILLQSSAATTNLLNATVDCGGIRIIEGQNAVYTTTVKDAVESLTVILDNSGSLMKSSLPKTEFHFLK